MAAHSLLIGAVTARAGDLEGERPDGQLHTAVELIGSGLRQCLFGGTAFLYCDARYAHSAKALSECSLFRSYAD